MPAASLSLFVTYTVSPENGAAMADALTRMAAAVKQHEPGCLTWRASRDREDPNRFHLYEQYVDDAAFEVHTRSDHFQELIVGIARKLAITRQAYRGDVLAD